MVAKLNIPVEGQDRKGTFFRENCLFSKIAPDKIAKKGKEVLWGQMFFLWRGRVASLAAKTGVNSFFSEKSEKRDVIFEKW